MLRWFPDWRFDSHKKMTLRMVLNHTSCIQSAPSTEEIYESRDWVRLALDANLVCDPGTQSSCNNKAVNLLAAVVQKVSGEPLDEYVRRKLFSPLGIQQVEWAKDGVGTPQCMAGLSIRPGDLARIGEMMLEGGVWHGNKIISRSWLQASTIETQPNSPFGLLWWRVSRKQMGLSAAHIAAYRSAGLDSSILSRMDPLADKFFDRFDFYSRLGLADPTPQVMEGFDSAAGRVRSALGSYVAFRSGRLIGYEANGYLGQYMIVIPRDRLVAVRMMRVPANFDGEQGDVMYDFRELVTALVPHPED
jgi:CubicO group peptidase (beta-lactamase class C family)